MTSLPGQPWLASTRKAANLDFNEARDDGVAVTSAEPYANHLHCASDPIATPAPHHLIFYRPDALPDDKSTVSNH